MRLPLELNGCHKMFKGTTISAFKVQQCVCVCFCLCRIQELGLRVAVRDFEREVWQRSLDNSRGAQHFRS